MHNMMLMLNRRFGPKTWSEILILRDQRIKEKEERDKKNKELAKKKAREDALKWDKYLKEFGKIIIVIGVVLGMYFYISWACKGCI